MAKTTKPIALDETLKATNDKLDAIKNAIEGSTSYRTSEGSYELPVATETRLGGIKVGNNLSITEDGVLSATGGGGGGSYELPIASSSTLGGVKVGTNLSIASDGTLSSTDTKYTLPNATSSTLGGVKVGTNLSVSSGKVSVATASTSSLGVMKVGSNLSVSSGTVSVPTATTSTLGVMKVGSNLSVSSGTVSVPTATTSTAGVMSVGDRLKVSSGKVSLNLKVKALYAKYDEIIHENRVGVVVLSESVSGYMPIAYGDNIVGAYTSSFNTSTGYATISSVYYTTFGRIDAKTISKGQLIGYATWLE